MMESAQIAAIETRTRWLDWARTSGSIIHTYADIMPAYIRVLETGDTFFMNRKFCSLVDHARETVPDNMTFDSKWLHAPQGWLYLEEPFEVPSTMVVNNEVHEFPTPRIRAVGWLTVPADTEVGKQLRAGATLFLCFMENKHGFGCWSYFGLHDGDILLERINHFEETANLSEHYQAGHVRDMKHEMRWTYTALYLMAQRLAMEIHEPCTRGQRRRMEREKRQISSFIRVVTLRRMEMERPRSEGHEQPDWQWQWEVRGHWRNQFYKGGIHKPKWIEAYIKGPEDKPFKSTGRLFVAAR